MRVDDIVTDFLRRVCELSSAITRERAIKLEMQLRAEFGGGNYYVRKADADRAESPRHRGASGGLLGL